MIIRSEDNKSFISIEQTLSDQYTSYYLEASVDIGHGYFKAGNIDIIFFNLGEFLKAFDKFIIDRGECSLLGTYDSYIKFYGNATNVYAEFTIGDAFCGKETFSFITSGTFEIDQSFLQPFLEEFRIFQINADNNK